MIIDMTAPIVVIALRQPNGRKHIFSYRLKMRNLSIKMFVIKSNQLYEIKRRLIDILLIFSC